MVCRNTAPSKGPAPFQGGLVRFFFAPTRGTLRCSSIVAVGFIALIIWTGCGAPNLSAASTQEATSVAEPTGTNTTTIPPVLLFNGTGTSSTDVAAVEAVLT